MSVVLTAGGGHEGICREIECEPFTRDGLSACGADGGGREGWREGGEEGVDGGGGDVAVGKEGGRDCMVIYS